MKSPKRILAATQLLPILISLAFSTTAHTQTSSQTTKSSDDLRLEQLLKSHMDEKALHAPAKPFSMSEAIQTLQTFKAAAKTEKCADASKTLFEQKYVMTADAQGKPCRVYDLSFPNLKALFTSLKPMQVPVRAVTSAEYLNWINGNGNAVANQNSQYRRNFNPRQAARNSWIAGLKFRQRPQAVFGSRLFPNEIGLPQSFTLADLDLGQKFQFDSKTQNQIQSLLNEVRSNKNAVLDDADDILSAETLETLNKPESILKKIKFNWNDLEKVYDVAIEGNFLPFSGPVVLIDYQTQYKYAVEKMIRSFLTSGLTQLARTIPNPTVSAIVEVAVTDVFEQIELMYDSQMLQFEGALRSHMADASITVEDMALSNRALNLLYGQKSDLFSNYILSVVQGKPFDWTAFERMGKSSRYSNEKARDIMMSKMNSRLVLEKKCKTEIIQDYFAVCSINGQKNAIYSLISERNIFSKSFGAPMIYRYSRPYEAAALRGGAWLLSIAVRVIGLPISRNLTGYLDNQLKSFMHSGLLDEALMKQNLSAQMRAGQSLTSEGQSIMTWMYIQNLNPFTPKSMNSENKLIAINKQLIGM